MKISYDKILSCADKIEGIAGTIQEITEELTILSKDISGFSRWQGPAAEYTSTQFSNIVSTFPEVLAGFRSSGTYLTEMVSYRKTSEQAIMSRLGQGKQT